MQRNFGDTFRSVSVTHRGPGSGFMKSFESAKMTFGPEGPANETFDIGPIRMNAPHSTLYDAYERVVLLTR
jgi:hypothetical protein